MNVQCCQLKAYTPTTNSYLQVLARHSMARTLISTLVDPVFGQSVAEFLYVHELVLAWNLCKDLRDNFSSDIVTNNGVIETWLQLQRIRQFSVFTCNHAQCKPRGKWHRSIMSCYDAHGEHRRCAYTKIVWHRIVHAPKLCGTGEHLHQSLVTRLIVPQVIDHASSNTLSSSGTQALPGVTDWHRLSFAKAVNGSGLNLYPSKPGLWPGYTVVCLCVRCVPSLQLPVSYWTKLSVYRRHLSMFPPTSRSNVQTDQWNCQGFDRRLRRKLFHARSLYVAKNETSVLHRATQKTRWFVVLDLQG